MSKRYPQRSTVSLLVAGCIRVTLSTILLDKVALKKSEAPACMQSSRFQAKFAHRRRRSSYACTPRRVAGSSFELSGFGDELGIATRASHWHSLAKVAPLCRRTPKVQFFHHWRVASEVLPLCPHRADALSE